MTIKNYATLVLVIGVSLVSGIVVHAYGGISQLFNTETLLALFGINCPSSCFGLSQSAQREQPHLGGRLQSLSRLSCSMQGLLKIETFVPSGSYPKSIERRNV